MAAIDRTDPAARVDARLTAFERRQRLVRKGVSCAVLVPALVLPVVAAPVTGESGATVGAVLASILLLGTGIAFWPWSWPAEEREHYELLSIWEEARACEDPPVPWDRFAAWATADGPDVKLVRLCWAGDADGPSSLSASVVCRVDAEDITGAATAMERLRQETTEMEAASRQRHLDSLSLAERRAHEEALRHIDEAAEAEQRQAETEMRREAAAEEAAEREAQAAAVARALRKP